MSIRNGHWKRATERCRWRIKPTCRYGTTVIADVLEVSTSLAWRLCESGRIAAVRTDSGRRGEWTATGAAVLAFVRAAAAREEDRTPRPGAAA